MVITISDTDDFIRALRENEEFQAAARRELLTQDLLQLPREFRAFSDRTDERLEEIGGEIKEARNDIDGLGEAFRREVRAQSSFRGNYAQRAAIGSNYDIARPFADLRGMGLIRTSQVSRTTTEDWLKNNVPLVQSLNLRDRAWGTFLTPDNIAAVLELQAASDSEPAFYIVVEPSYTGEEEDLQRAVDHAKIVRAVTGRDAYPVVAAVVLDDQMEIRGRLYKSPEQFVNANDPDSALWFRLDSADLRPPEPL